MYRAIYQNEQKKNKIVILFNLVMRIPNGLTLNVNFISRVKLIFNIFMSLQAKHERKY